MNNDKKLLRISSKSDRYKLCVYIYLNRVLLDARQMGYGFKSVVEFGSCQKKNQNHTVLEAFCKIVLKIISLTSICDSWFNFRKN